MKAKKLPSGNWRVLVYDYTDAAGKRHYKSFTDPDKNVAMFMANDYLSHHRGEAAATYADLTLKQAAERYVDSKEGVLSPSTVKEYRRVCASLRKRRGIGTAFFILLFRRIARTSNFRRAFRRWLTPTALFRSQLRCSCCSPFQMNS